uniref:Quinone oxidoreductase, putative n=1 Tax=Ixodes scapularis TaxID=6945 RepID=A0A1S4KWP0_IXOSC
MTLPTTYATTRAAASMSVMRAIQVNKFGGPQVLQECHVPIPKVTPGKVLVRVKAAGVNPIDTLIREGTYPTSFQLPYTPGKDGAGLVEEVGEGDTPLKARDRVFFCNRDASNVHGSYAQYSLLKATDVWPLPEKISFQQGACLGIPYLTAYKALVLKAKVTADKLVLVHGASGAVGTAAVQIAKHFKAKVAGTAGTPAGMDVVKQRGADLVKKKKLFSHLVGFQKWTNDRGVDIILEMLANVNLPVDFNMIGQNGLILVIGSRGDVKVNPCCLMGKESAVMGIALMKATPEEWQAMAENVARGAEEGWIKPVMDRVYPLGGAKAAHHDLINRKGAKGKVTLDPDQ